MGSALCLWGLAAAAQSTSSFNTAHIRQTSPELAARGNQIVVDQSQATGSRVGGVTLNAPLLGESAAPLNAALSANGNDPLYASQTGEGNAATLTLGDNSHVQLFQASRPTGMELGDMAVNVAQITAAANAQATAIQVGELNEARLNVGLNAVGLIGQIGRDLSADLSVERGGNGSITQIGQGSTADLTILSDTSVQYIQQGDNLTSPTVTGVQVFSNINTGNIVITQTSR